MELYSLTAFNELVGEWMLPDGLDPLAILDVKSEMHLFRLSQATPDRDIRVEYTLERVFFADEIERLKREAV